VPRTLHTPEQEALADLLRSVRKEAGLRQSELAKLLDRPQSFVSKIESGDRRIDLVELRQFCRALGLPLLELVRRFEDSVDGRQGTRKR
jgi:transcriptional regulator with XRE-family HTH domain